MEFSNKYIIGFTIALCLVCSIAASSINTLLKDRQESNKLHDKRVNVLRAAQLIGPQDNPLQDSVEKIFAQEIEVLDFDQATAEKANLKDVWKFDPRKGEVTMPKKKDTWGAMAKAIAVKGMPKTLIAYKINTPGKECLVLPFYGNGLWSLMRGFLAIHPDKNEVVGITFYEHGETAGLGAEVENPIWQSQWPGKKCFDNKGNPILNVVKQGKIKSPQFEVDGISGATITSVAVGDMMKLWLGDAGYGPLIEQQRREQ